MVRSSLPTAPAPARARRRESRTLPGEARSVPEARRFVRDVLRRWGREDVEEAGTLLTSELVGNVVLHARSEVTVEVLEDGDAVVLVVADGSPTLPVRRRHSREAGTGRGLWLLDQYSSDHGVDLSRPGSGKAVWAVLCPDSSDAGEGSDAALAMWLDSVDGL